MVPGEKYSHFNILYGKNLYAQKLREREREREREKSIKKLYYIHELQLPPIRPNFLERGSSRNIFVNKT